MNPSLSLNQPRNTVLKVVAVTLVLGVLTFLASPGAPLGGFWGASPEAGPAPSGVQIGLLMLIGAIQSIVFGLGVAFLVFGYPLVSAAAPEQPGLARAAYLSIAWSLVQWWPHSNLHQTVGHMDGLIAIEYGFHVTTMIATLIVAYFFITVLRRAALR